MKILKLFIIFSLALLLTGCRSKNNDTAHNKRIVLTESQIRYIIGESVDELMAYHGSGANFDKFNHKKYLNSGCGSQSFGWGSYVTDDVAIGKSYAEGIGDNAELEFDGNDIKDENVFEDTFRSNTQIKDNQELYNLYKIFLSNGFDISKVIKLCNSDIENAQKFLTTVTDESGKENKSHHGTIV